MQGCFLKNNGARRLPTASSPDSGPLPCFFLRAHDTVESTIYERKDKLDDQKHGFYKFMHQTDRRVQVL